MERSLSSEKALAGDPVRLTVVHPLKIGGCMLIAQDAIVEGRVIEAQRKTGFGRNGLLDIPAERVQAADGSWVRLRHAPVKMADPATTGFSTVRTVAGLIWYAPAAPVIKALAKGKEVWIPKSARFNVYADEQRDFGVERKEELRNIGPIQGTSHLQQPVKEQRTRLRDGRGSSIPFSYCAL